MGKRSKNTSHNKSISIGESESVKILGINMKNNNDLTMIYCKNDDSLLNWIETILSCEVNNIIIINMR
jgi:hypothetical protein